MLIESLWDESSFRLRQILILKSFMSAGKYIYLSIESTLPKVGSAIGVFG
jgi:hypothetical protein